MLHRDRVARTARWTLTVLGGVALALVIALSMFDWNLLRAPLARLASARTGRAVHIDGALHVHIWSLTPRVEADGVRVANTEWAGGGDMIRIGHLVFDLRLLPFLGGRAVIPLIEIDHARFDLVRDRGGRTNWSLGNSASEGGPLKLPPIRHFVIDDAHLQLTDLRRKLVFTGAISSNESVHGANRGFWMTGEGTLNRAPFKAVIHGAPLLNVDATQPYPFTLDVRAGATHVAATGAITHPFDFARITAKASFSGNDLANLYYLTGLTLPNTPAYSVTGDLSRDGELYRYNRFAGRIGHSDLSGSLSVDDSGDRPLLTADARSRYVNFDDLGFLFGGGKGRDTAPKAPAASTAPAKSGEITVADAPQPRTLLLPDAPLQIDRVRQMDAKVRYMADRIESRDLPLRRLSLNLTLRNGVLTLDPVSATFVHGRIDGTARIDASRDVPVSAVDLRLRDIALQQFLARQNPPALEGTVEARARLTGTGDTVHKAASTANGTLTVVVPHGQVRKAFAELMGVDLLNGGWALLTNDKSPTQLRCMVASFDAHDGVLSTRRLTFDTDVVTATGHGTVDLRNETLDLTLNGQPKKLRIGRIKAPVEVTGSLQAPHVGVDAGKVLPQAGIGAALGAFVAPLVAILPFVNPGLAKDADCGALIDEARARGAPVKRR